MYALPLCRPLLYGLRIEEDFKALRSYAFESKDYQVTPGSPWSYALLLHNDYQPENDLKFVSKKLNSTYPFSPDGAPSYIEATVSTSFNHYKNTYTKLGM